MQCCSTQPASPVTEPNGLSLTKPPWRVTNGNRKARAVRRVWRDTMPEATESMMSMEPASPVARTSRCCGDIESLSTPATVGPLWVNGNRMVPFYSFIVSSISSAVRWHAASRVRRLYVRRSRLGKRPISVPFLTVASRVVCLPGGERNLCITTEECLRDTHHFRAGEVGSKRLVILDEPWHVTNRWWRLRVAMYGRCVQNTLSHGSNARLRNHAWQHAVAKIFERFQCCLRLS